jgi:hypothetical protein
MTLNVQGDTSADNKDVRFSENIEILGGSHVDKYSAFRRFGYISIVAAQYKNDLYSFCYTWIVFRAGGNPSDFCGGSRSPVRRHFRRRPHRIGAVHVILLIFTNHDCFKVFSTIGRLTAPTSLFPHPAFCLRPDRNYGATVVRRLTPT